MAIDFHVSQRCPHCNGLNKVGPNSQNMHYCIFCGKELPQEPQKSTIVVQLTQTDYPGIHILTPRELNDLLEELAGLFNRMSPSQVRDIQAKIDKILRGAVDAPA